VAGAPEKSKARWRAYQTGLLLPDGRPKPSLFAFPLPFFAQRRGSSIRAFGEVRPGAGRRRVEIEIGERPGHWKPGPSFETGDDGTFRRTLPGPGIYRFRWERPGPPAYSAPATVPPGP
jgi:hypothetical protein